MRRIVRTLVGILLGLFLSIPVLLLLSPTARQLAPAWLYYDLVARQFAPLPPSAEQWLQANGREFCAIGRDSDCGGYKLVNARAMAIGNAAPPGTVEAWCVDYVVLRRNQSRLTGDWVFWANIPRAAVLLRSGAGNYDLFATEDCRTATLQRPLPNPSDSA